MSHSKYISLHIVYESFFKNLDNAHVFSKNILYYHVGVSSMEWTGKNAAKNHLRLVITSIFIADFRLRNTHKSRFWNQSLNRSFAVLFNKIILCFHFIWQFQSICLNVMRAAFHVELLVRFASGWIGRSIGLGTVRFGSRIRFVYFGYFVWKAFCQSVGE